MPGLSAWAFFILGTREKIKALNAETQRKSEKDKTNAKEVDPGVEVRRRISFRSTNLIGSFQDDIRNEAKSKTHTRHRRDGTPTSMESNSKYNLGIKIRNADQVIGVSGENFR
jgi:hypothetical protein